MKMQKIIGWIFAAMAVLCLLQTIVFTYIGIFGHSETFGSAAGASIAGMALFGVVAGACLEN